MRTIRRHTEKFVLLKIRKNIERLMDSKALNAKMLAVAAGVSIASAYRIMNGESKPSVHKLIRFSEALNVSLNDLVK